MRVAILVAARNEQAGIRRLLASLQALTYPAAQLEIWLGDDASEDDTLAILQAWAHHLPHARAVAITTPVSRMAGKANVLAQLAAQATADVLLFTDADCAVPPGWVQAMLAPLRTIDLRTLPNGIAANAHKQTGIVTGVTAVRGGGAFAKMQSVDWLVAQWVIYLLALVGIPVTAMGNNMAVTRGAYLAAGGFAAVGSSIVEDYALFINVLGAGYGFAHCFAPSALAYTDAQPDSAAWLAQRKRWFYGAMQLPLSTQLPFWLQVWFYPLLVVVGLLFGWQVAMWLWACKVSVQTLLFAAGLVRLGQYRLLIPLLLYEPFAAVSAVWLWLNYRQDSSVVWKGRAYSNT